MVKSVRRNKKQIVVGQLPEILGATREKAIPPYVSLRVNEDMLNSVKPRDRVKITAEVVCCPIEDRVKLKVISFEVLPKRRIIGESLWWLKYYGY